MMPMLPILPCIGLFVAMSNVSVPLTAVHYNFTVRSFASHVTINQTYKNDGFQDIEAVYGFPINDQASIVGLTVVIGNRTLTSQFKKKEEASKIYTDAVANHDGAYLLDQSQRSDDTFVLRVGRLPPGKECVVSISYVGTLESITDTKQLTKHDHFLTRLTIPTALSPRYSPSSQGSSSGVVAPEKYQSNVPYMATLSGHIEAVGVVQSVSSQTHPLAVTILGPKEVSVQFGARQQPLNRDLFVEIEVKPNPKNTNGVNVEVEQTVCGQYTALLTVLPNFTRAGLAVRDSGAELIFLVDCSGSMNGQKIEDARRAMQIFIRSIPEGAYFNFYVFGSTYSSLFPESQLYSASTFEQAKNFADRISDDLGGTEILEPMQKIFSKPPRAGYNRQLFVLTDGEVTNTNQVIALVNANAANTRVFSFGLGDSPSRSLVNGIATAGNGKAEFIKEGEGLESIVVRNLNRALQPSVTDVSLTWHGVKNVQQVPTKLPPIFQGDRLNVYAMFEKEDTLYDDGYDNLANDGEMYAVLQVGKFKTKIRLTKSANVDGGCENAQPFLSKLAARELIKQLETSQAERPRPPPSSSWSWSSSGSVDREADDGPEDQITALSLKYGVLSKYVSLVAVENRTDAERLNATYSMQQVTVPIEQTPHSRPTYTGGFGGGMGPFVGGGGSSSSGAQNSNMAMLPLMMSMMNQQSNQAGRQDAGQSQSHSSNNCNITSIGSPRSLTCLLDLQQWDGTWSSSAGLERLTGTSLTHIKAAVPSQTGLDDSVLTTIFVMQYVREKFGGQSDVWRSSIQKTDNFLSKQTDQAAVVSATSALLNLVRSR